MPNSNLLVGFYLVGKEKKNKEEEEWWMVIYSKRTGIIQFFPGKKKIFYTDPHKKDLSLE